MALMRGVRSMTQRLGLSETPSVPRMKYLSQEEAIKVDEKLFETFSLESLMELAGLSVAAAVLEEYPDKKRVLCVCGPGNNGGDGLIAARHLKFFGFAPSVVYPKKKFPQLIEQMDQMEIPVFGFMPELSQYDLILDCVFGFSFKGEAREPFALILNDISNSRLPIVSVDVPSGWDVEEGPTGETALQPSMLISLTAPKQCAAKFAGPHYLGGRFVPPSVQKAFGFSQPTFSSSSQVIRLDTLPADAVADAAQSSSLQDDDDDDDPQDPTSQYYYF